MAKVWERRPFEYDEIDVLKQKKWKELYQYEVPVVHVDATKENDPNFETSAEARKLWHRFTQAELEEAMDQATGSKEEPQK